MLPALVFPFYDPNNWYYPHLQAALPDLKNHFARAYISLPETSTRRQPENTRQLLADDFFRCYPLPGEAPIGKHWGALYRQTAWEVTPEQILHLCFPDRLLFALRTAYRDSFLAETASLHLEHLPLIYQRSPLAWATHPQNYARIEGFVTRIGEQLFGKTLDYGWCHFVISAGELRRVMALVTSENLDMVAEMILHCQHHIHTRAVDWLAWEDPFILDRDPAELKTEREAEAGEYEKRMSYCLPMVEKLVKFSGISKFES